MVIVLIIVAAAAALALGLLTGPFLLVWVALGLSLVGVVMVVVSLVRGRSTAAGPADAVVPADEPVDAGQDADETPVEADVAEVTDGAPEVEPTLGTVLVRADRKRFHQEGCRVLDGAAEIERIHVDEAAAEGFTACSVCIPDRSSLGVGS